MIKGRIRRTYLYDMRKGTRENLGKWSVALFIFLFWSKITVTEAVFLEERVGFIGSWLSILGGMPEYIKTDTSIFELPISWLLFYAYLFFLVGFYPTSDLHGCGAKTLLFSESRNAWVLSKFLWIQTQVLMYFLLFGIALFINDLLFDGTGMDLKMMYEIYGIAGKDSVMQAVIWGGFVLPVLVTVAMAFVQYMISVCIGAISGYIFSVAMLVISAYWMRNYLPGNYLMILRNELINPNGMNTGMGIIISMGLIIVSVIITLLVFRKKDIYKVLVK